jgi:hypothetical protein
VQGYSHTYYSVSFLGHLKGTKMNAGKLKKQQAGVALEA